MPNVSNCPQCNAYQAISLHKNQLRCSECSFAFDVLCLYCGIGQLESVNDLLVCSHCKREQSEAQIAYILKNRLQVNLDDKCQYCNSPTLSRPGSNILPRCFDHPNCANQTSLFEFKSQDKPHVFLDFETTGLEIGNESIIEIGACKVDKDGKEHFFQELVKPVVSIKPLITKITGINDGMVTHAPSLKQALGSFLEFCGDAHIIAHNAQFDIPWLLVSLLRHDFNIPFTHVLCTLKWAKQKEDGKRSLGALSKKYQIGHENAHRALADAVVTKSLFYIYNKNDEDEPFEPVDRYLNMSKKIVTQFSDFKQP